MFVYLQMIDSQEDHSKFEQIYREYCDLMYFVANRILNNAYDAEDAVHNAFLTIAKNIKKIDIPVCPKTKRFVITIVESKAIDMYRYKQRHPQVAYDEETVGIKVEYSGSWAIVRCISHLPTRYRHVLSLKYQFGFNNKEIAKILNTSESNAAKLIQRAKVKLSELCKEEGVL